MIFKTCRPFNWPIISQETNMRYNEKTNTSLCYCCTANQFRESAIRHQNWPLTHLVTLLVHLKIWFSMPFPYTNIVIHPSVDTTCTITLPWPYLLNQYKLGFHFSWGGFSIHARKFYFDLDCDLLPSWSKKFNLVVILEPLDFRGIHIYFIFAFLVITFLAKLRSITCTFLPLL